MLKIACALSVAFLACPLSASANEMDDAMKQIGPAYMCGAPYEYREKLNNLKAAMERAGVDPILSQFAIDGLDHYVTRQNSAKRATVTAEECLSKYHRPRT